MTPSSFGHLTPETLALFADRYELTMLQGYLAREHTPEAAFSLYFRDLPRNRGYVVAAGLEQVLAALDSLTFGERALTYLAEEGFDDDFLDSLADFSFSGDVRAVPEGTVVFPNEPLVEVRAPLPEAQLLETLFLNQVGFQSLVATKAARMRDVVEREGDGQTLVDFGSRRAHGTDAGLKAARAAYVGGFDGTSLLAAGEAFGVPTYGTMAHSWVQSFPTEREAFEAFVDTYGDESTLLIDTYDTVAGAELAGEVAREAGVDLRGVRLDSGDLAALSKQVHERLPDADVFVSSGMDEYTIREFLRSDGMADGFGPGTALTTSRDAPSLDPVYKLVAVEREGEGGLQPSMKLSSGKLTYPGEKRVGRVEADGVYVHDVLGKRDEAGPGRDLLEPVVRAGERVSAPPTLDEIRETTRRNVRSLPPAVRDIEEPGTYEVRVSDGLAAETERLRTRLERREG
ncbi:nicotinate phosphoribosyltransferase [Salinigranum halophilum]|uniref:nicotinate phosphoribosyltransferase n=1 Tax=Salinigranum halophilum TaxID=2565931 RepID=UPI0010A76F74|nr:nicotinate phosphoribosyltransferase [Salinigranum halophilum]